MGPLNIYGAGLVGSLFLLKFLALFSARLRSFPYCHTVYSSPSDPLSSELLPNLYAKLGFSLKNFPISSIILNCK